MRVLRVLMVYLKLSDIMKNVVCVKTQLNILKYKYNQNHV